MEPSSRLQYNTIMNELNHAYIILMLLKIQKTLF